MNLCPGEKQAVRYDHCDLCKAMDDIFKSAFNDNGTKAEVKQIFQQTCAQKPSPTNDQVSFLYNHVHVLLFSIISTFNNYS